MSTLTDTYSNDDKRLDAKGGYALNERVQVFVEMQNRTHGILRQYTGQRRDWIVDYERLGRTCCMGVALKW